MPKLNVYNNLEDRINHKSTIITLGLGLFIGVIGASSFIAIYEQTQPLWLAYLFLGLILFFSFLFIFIWSYKKRLIYKIAGVELKDLSTLVKDIGIDVEQRNYENINTRLYETISLWSILQSRRIFIGLIVYLSTALFLMLTSYVGLKQINMINEQTKVFKTQKEISSIMLIDELKKDHALNDDISKLKSQLNICDKNITNEFSYIVLNQYLDFFEKVAELERKKIFSISEINNFFGIDMITFYFNKNVQQEYIIKGRDKFGDWYQNSIALAHILIELPDNKKAISELIKQDCITKDRIK